MNERTEQDMREAFAKKCPEDDVMLRLAEDNQDFWLDAINARHALARFREGWLAAQASIAAPQPQTVRGALEKAADKCIELGDAWQHPLDFKRRLMATECAEQISALIEPLSAATGWQGENAMLTKEKPNELISALKQAYLVIYKLYEHYDSSEKAYGFAETLATIDKALANYATHSGVAVQEPEGWKLVPIDPTKIMIEAARTHYESQAYTGAVSTYKAMLAASPLDKE